MRASVSLGLALLSLVAPAQVSGPPPVVFFSPSGDREAREPSALAAARVVSSTAPLGHVYHDWLVIREPSERLGILVPTSLTSVAERLRMLDFVRAITKASLPDGSVDLSKLTEAQMQHFDARMGAGIADQLVKGDAKLTLLPGYVLSENLENPRISFTMTGDYPRDGALYPVPPGLVRTVPMIEPSLLPILPHDWEVHAFGRAASALESEAGVQVLRKWVKESEKEIAAMDADIARNLPQAWYSKAKTTADLPEFARASIHRLFEKRWRACGFETPEAARDYAATMPLRWESFTCLRLIPTRN